MRKLYGFELLLMIIVCFPATAFAQRLNITHVDAPAAGTKASNASFSIYFDLYDRNGKPVRALRANDCSLMLARRSPKILKQSLLRFRDGNRSVGVLVLFPNSKNYSEDSFGIRGALIALRSKIERDIDMFNIVTYDTAPVSSGWMHATDRKLMYYIEQTRVTDVVEPNLFAAFPPALGWLEELKDVDRKFLVIITDAEGAIFSDREKAWQLINQFSSVLEKSDVTPIVVGYSPDGYYAMPNIHMLRPIVSKKGISFTADNEQSFRNIILGDVYKYIWGSYLYQVTYDLTDQERLEPGRYYMQLKAHTSEGDVIGYTDFKLEDLQWWNLLWLWVALGAAGSMSLMWYGVYRWRQKLAQEAAERRRIDAEDRWAEKIAREFAEEKSSSLLPVPFSMDDEDISMVRVPIENWPVRPADIVDTDESESVEVMSPEEAARVASERKEKQAEAKPEDEVISKAEALLNKALDDADREDKGNDGEKTPSVTDVKGDAGEHKAAQSVAKAVHETKAVHEKEKRMADAKDSSGDGHKASACDACWAHSQYGILMVSPHQRFADKFSIYMDTGMDFADTDGIRVTKDPPADFGMIVRENLTTVREYANGEKMLGMASIRKDA